MNVISILASPYTNNIPVLGEMAKFFFNLVLIFQAIFLVWEVFRIFSYE